MAAIPVYDDWYTLSSASTFSKGEPNARRQCGDAGGWMAAIPVYDDWYTLSRASTFSISENDCVPLAHVLSAFLLLGILTYFFRTCGGFCPGFGRLSFFFFFSNFFFFFFFFFFRRFFFFFFFFFFIFSVSLDGTA